MRGQFSLRSVGLPCDTLILVMMTWSIVRLLEGKHSVRFFPFNLFISASNISAPKPPKCPPNLMWRSREWSYSPCLGRNKPSTTSAGGHFGVTNSTPIKKSKSSINFVRHFLDKQRNVLKIIDVRVLYYTYTRGSQIAISLIFFYNCFACCRCLSASSWSSAIYSCHFMLRSLFQLMRKLSYC